MGDQFWKQICKQLCWVNLTTPETVGERWEGRLTIHIGDTGNSEIKGMVGLPLAYLHKTPDIVIGASKAIMKSYRLRIIIGNGGIRRALTTRLGSCFFETPEEGKKALEDIISTTDMSSLAL